MLSKMDIKEKLIQENSEKGKRKGILCVVSSPSGGGKTTVIQAVLERHPEYRYSISATTREKRPGEVHGKNYYFLSEEEFNELVEKNGFIEWANVHNDRYGTLKKPVEELLREGEIILLDIDVVGGVRVKKLFPEQSLLIFLKPPSMKELKRRLRERKSETQDQIKKRLERLPMEIQYADYYDVQIINKQFETTVHKVGKVIEEVRSNLEVKTE